MRISCILSVIVVYLFQSINLIAQPNSISGLTLWLKSDYGVILNGSVVAEWQDASGNNNHCVQTNTTLQPIYFNSVPQINNKPSISFDGVDDYMPFTTALTNIRTTFFVIKHNGINVPFAPILGDNAGYDFMGDDVSNHIFSDTYASTNIKNGNIRINRTAIGTVTNAVRPVDYSIISLTTTGNVTASQITRDRSNTNRVWGGEYSEIIIYNRVLSISEVGTIEAYLVNKYAPTIVLGSDIVIQPLNGCVPSNTVTIQANPDFQSFLWNTGNTSNQINVTQYGEYSVICTDIFGINHYDTVKVIPSPKNFNYPASNIICGNSSITWNTQLNNVANQFQWQDNSIDSLITINAPGQYFVKVTDTFGCVYNSNTLTISQDNFATSVSLGNDTSLCSGNLITLTSGANAVTSYTWSNGSNNDSLLINIAGQYSVIVTNTNNCVARDTINVTIQGLAPIANFSASTGCQNNAVSFTNLSSAPSGTIANSNWNFADPASGTFSTSTVSNPFHTFSDTGIYSVRLNVITSDGCEQSITKTIHIAPKPTVNFSIGNSCQNDSTTFSNLSTSIPGYSITALNWNFGDPGPSNTSSVSNPKHVFSSQTNYTVSLTVTNNAGCSTTSSSVIAVKPQVKADFTFSTPCTNTATVFHDNSIASSSLAGTRSWNFGGPPVSGITVPRTYTATGPYNVSLTVTVNGCTSSINKIITIFSPPLVSFTIPAFCSKDTIAAINSSVAQSGIISSYNWRLNNNSFSSVQNPTLSLSSAGNYPVRLTVVNSFGCKDSVTKTITVNPLPLVDFTTNPANYYYINEPISFSPSIPNASSYSWNVTGVMTSTLQNPSVSINSEGTYTASLDLQDQQGCKNSKTKTILVSKRYLDLAILNVTTIKDDDGFMTVVADIANYGTVPATAMNLQYQISDGGNNKESWTGVLNPNSYFSYTFSSTSASQANTSNNITCVAIKKVNGIDDENQNNNDLCSSLYYDEVSVSNPFPNPTAENLTLPVILNKDIDFTLSIYTSTGQILFEETTQKGLMGLNLVSIPTSSYAWGCYIIKVVIDDKLFVKKFIKVNN